MKNRKFAWMNEKLESRPTQMGDGVFAKGKIKKGELLSIFGGYIISFKEEASLPEKNRDIGIQIHDNFVLSVVYKKENADNFNHSCNPNAGIRGQIFVEAMRDIKKDEQVTFDYAMCLSYTKKYAPYFYKMKCLCGEKGCRGFVTANDWKKPELQEKYKGYFQWYVQQKIDKLSNKNAK